MDVRILLILMMLGALAMAASDNMCCFLEIPRTARGTDKGGQRRRSKVHRERKKDMYVSRGWGPGGMPFSVLYLNPTHATAQKVMLPVAARQQQQQHAPKAGGPLAPRVRTAMRNGQTSAVRQHSVVPQLFVSYNWAPMG